jgi:LysR family transcriptional regulator, hydrogen peroxide-inducible genes activator
MNLRDLRYIVALADHRHFGRAAEASFVSQPTLSTQIKKFEEELGIVIFERNPRNVMLTDTGEAVVARARQLLREADEIKAIAKRSKDPEAGAIRLGLFPTLGPYLLPHVMPQLVARFPKLEIMLYEDKTDVILAKLKNGDLDAGVLALPLADDFFHAEFLFEEDFVLALPQGHLLALKKSKNKKQPSSLRLEDLKDAALLLLEDGHCLRDQALDVCQMSGAREFQGYRATSLETLRHMVASNAGITLMPALSVHPPALQSAALVLRAFADPAPHRRIALVWRKASTQKNLLRQIAPIFKALDKSLLKAPATAIG